MLMAHELNSGGKTKPIENMIRHVWHFHSIFSLMIKQFFSKAMSFGICTYGAFENLMGYFSHFLAIYP